jgi:hypothetical protein
LSDAGSAGRFFLFYIPLYVKRDYAHARFMCWGKEFTYA